MRKRVIVGAYVMTWYVSPMYICPMVQLICNLHIWVILCYESFEIKQKEFETTLSYRLLKHTFIFLCFFSLQPKFGVLNREILTASNVT